MFDSGTWGIGSRPRPVSLDWEVVRFIEGVGATEVVATEDLPEDAQILTVLVCSTPDGFAVAGLAETPSVPGWPPMLSVAVNSARDEAAQDVVRAHGFRDARSEPSG